MEPLNVTELESFEQLDNDSLLVLEAGEGTVGFFTCVADNGVGRCEVTVLVVLVEEFSAAENVTSEGGRGEGERGREGGRLRVTQGGIEGLELSVTFICRRDFLYLGKKKNFSSKIVPPCLLSLFF